MILSLNVMHVRVEISTNMVFHLNGTLSFYFVLYKNYGLGAHFSRNASLFKHLYFECERMH